MVVIGGGQDASHVTATDHRAGKFEAQFVHKVLQEEIGGMKGHFGQINALAFNPEEGLHSLKMAANYYFGNVRYSDRA
uniref:Eukaryotic translation initiation factor 3 subunit I n=1 Tax=Elaeis guineensis var. tenera TaxID=51953 RepID=A0A6I9QY05_ELAGV|nr:eukaryotic translation initiation factor 3 subunit I [Elaeis guineensis]